jgi:transposase-like protein
VRKVAQYFGLPTKNYVTNWIEECKRKGFIPDDANKLNFQKPDVSIISGSNSSAVLKQLERENLMLRAELDFLKKVKQLERGNALRV